MNKWESELTLPLPTGTLPYIEDHPKIDGTFEPGEYLQLKCKATGKGSLHYVWQHENQTLVNETRQELIIKQVKESDQGAYKCRVANAFGYTMSNPAILKLSKCEAISSFASSLATYMILLDVVKAAPKVNSEMYSEKLLLKKKQTKFN